MEVLRSDQLSSLRDIFQTFARPMGGKLGLQGRDLYPILVSLSLPGGVSEADAHDLVTLCDGHNRGYLLFEDFVQLMTAPLKDGGGGNGKAAEEAAAHGSAAGAEARGGAAAGDTELERIFHKLDSNGDGVITQDELVRFVADVRSASGRAAEESSLQPRSAAVPDALTAEDAGLLVETVAPKVDGRGASFLTKGDFFSLMQMQV